MRRGLLTFVGVMICAVVATGEIGDIKAHYPLPHQEKYNCYPRGMGVSGNHLFIAVMYYEGTEYHQKMWAVLKNEGRIEWGFDIDYYAGNGVACDEAGVWLEEQKGVLVHYTSTGSFLKVWRLNGGRGYTSGLAYDGNDHLYVSSSDLHWLTKYDRNGNLKAWLQVTSDYRELAWDGTYLWALTQHPVGLIKVDQASGKRLWYVGLDPYIIERPTGLAHDGSNFWVVGNYVKDGKARVFKIDAGNVNVTPSSLGKVKALFR